MAQKDEDPTASDAEHVAYEVRCLRAGLRAMAQIEERELNNLVSEAVLIHVRNLLEFLYPGSRRFRDGLYASDFAVWSPTLDPEVDVFAGNRNVRAFQKRLHQRLAHLSKERKKEPAAAGTWSLDEVSIALDRELCDFWQALSSERRNWSGDPATFKGQN